MFATPYLSMNGSATSAAGRRRAGRVRSARSPRGALAVGSPEQVAEKVLFEHELFG